MNHSVELTRRLKSGGKKSELDIRMFEGMVQIMSGLEREASPKMFMGYYEKMFHSLGRVIRECKQLKCPGCDRPILAYNGPQYTFHDFLAMEPPDNAILFVHKAHRMIGVQDAEQMCLFLNLFEVKFPRNDIVLICGESWATFPDDRSREAWSDPARWVMQPSKRLEDERVAKRLQAERECSTGSQ
jgi:hypothetical protein